MELLAQEKNIKLIGKYKNITMIGSDILIYRLVYNLVENAIKYNHSDGQVTVNAYKNQNIIYLSVEDTGSGIPKNSGNVYLNHSFAWINPEAESLVV